MANTYTLISSVTVGAGGASSIDFTSIPATYTDLLVMLSLRSVPAATDVATYVRLNNDSSSTNYSYRRIYGNGSSVYSDTGSGLSYAIIGSHDASNATANTFANLSFYLPNYAGSSNKSFSTDAVTENNATSAIASLTAGL